MDYPPTTVQEFSSKKVLAGLMGILFGGFGIHKFVLGMPQAGLTMLLLSVLSCGIISPIMGLIGFIEGILYLTKSDEDFYNEYALEKKQWF